MDPMVWVWFAMLASVTTCFCVYFVLFFRDRRDRQETIRHALNLQQAIDKESLAFLSHGFADNSMEFRRALSSLGSGIGFVVAGVIFHYGGFSETVVTPVLALSAIIIGHGIGRIIASVLRDRKGD